jgi:amino acid adenylation domain-containing protein
MAKSNKITCIVVGEGNLPLKCMGILNEYGIEIMALVSGDEWLLQQNNLEPFPKYDHLKDLALFPTVDYIFSINNSLILKKEFTSLARRMAINYHDAPLPRYAGMYATNWALLNHETEHGISWHEVVDQIDAGDVVASQAVTVLPGDTALSLNTRCFEAALTSFDTLVQSIVAHQLRPVPQDLSKRSYFPYAARPDQLGLITHEMSAQSIDTLLRATNFSRHYANEFILPLLYIQNEYYTVAEATVDFSQKGQPGRVIYSGNQKGFYCLDGLVSPTLLYGKDGREANLEELLPDGAMLALPGSDATQKAATLFESLAKYEPFWRKRLALADYLPWPFTNCERSAEIIQTSIQDRTISLLMELFPTQKTADILTAVYAIFLLRLTGQSSGTLGFNSAELSQKISGLEAIYSPWLPLTVALDPTGTAISEVLKTLKLIRKIETSGTFLNSTRIRYPELRSNAADTPFIILSTTGSKTTVTDSASMVINIHEADIRYLMPDGNKFQGAGKLAESFEMFLQNLVNGPNLPIQQIELISAQKALQLCGNLNQEVCQAVQVDDVVDQFLRMAELYPEQTAIFDQGVDFSYSRFKTDVVGLATKLTNSGILPDQVVAVAIDRNYHYFVAIMAILKCGACFLPLDPTLPLERKQFFCKDSGVKLLLTDHPEGALGIELPVLIVEELETIALPHQQTSSYHPDSPAYIIYTSGSTGVPKGVKLSRKALANFVSGALGLFQTTNQDHVMQFSNLAFDASIEEIFMAFCSGATLYLRTAEMLQADELVEFTARHKISVWDLPTAFWRQLLQSASYQNQPLPESLRLVIIGGEAVTNNDIELWNGGKSSYRLINTYGPTETTVVALAFEIGPGYQPEHSVPIGQPLPGYKIYITNQNHQLVPEGVPGELLISGDSLATGYINREPEQNKAFIWMQTPDQGLQRCYCTGDLVSVDMNGLVLYQGRIDAQVKIRGYRVEPGEIEQQILSMDGIESAVVAVHTSESGEKSLYAFFTTNKGTIDATTIKAVLKQRLPAYMVPELILPLAEIPLTTNGKVDKKGLLLMAKNHRVVSTNESALPTNETEEYLLNLWKRTLQVETMGIDDDFFDLGGHSLKAVQMISEIKQQKGINIPLASLIQNSSVRLFATLFSSDKKDNFWSCLVPIRPAGTKTPLFLIHGAGLNILLYQSLTHHMSPDRPIYAFQAKGLDGTSEFSNNIEEMADDYLEEIIKVQPEGPYLLLGFSLGGFIAWDMAKKLTKQGLEVRFTGMIDSVSSMAKHIRSPFKLFLFKVKMALIRPIYVMWLILKEPMATKKQLLQKKLRSFRFTVVYTLTKLGLLKKKERKISMEDGEPMFLADNVELAMTEALVKYEITAAPLKIDLFQAGVPTFYIPNSKDYGWSRFAKKGVVVHIIPSEHSRIFAPPNDKLFAEKLDRRLDELESTK